MSRISAEYGDIENQGPLKYLTLQDFLVLICIAVLASLVNAIKPFHIDDTYLFWLAQQIVDSPSDPFGLEIFWEQVPIDAHKGFVPPLFPYWLAGSLSLFGDNPFLLKLSIFPFFLIFVTAVFQLGKRFCHDLALPLAIFVCISPTILPGVNLMLDLPCAALALWSIELFIRGIERESIAAVCGSAVLASLAVMTKYTALVTPGVILLIGALTGKIRWSIRLGLFVVFVIVCWEYLHNWRYGQTQLFWNLLISTHRIDAASNGTTLAIAAIVTLGGLCSILLVPFLPMRVPNKVLPAAVLGLFSVLLITYFSSDHVDLMHAAFYCLGSVFLLMIGISLVGAGKGHQAPHEADQYLKAQVFLVGWLALEIAGYIIISPFPAVRRLLMIFIILSILAFRFLMIRMNSCEAARPIITLTCWSLVSVNVLLTALYFQIDYAEAKAQQEIVELATTEIRNDEPNAVIWYTGHWGFAYYAEKAGLQPAVPDRSVLQQGHFLVMTDWVHSQHLAFDEGTLEFVSELTIRDNIPFRTIPAFYGKSYPITLKKTDARLKLQVFRINKGYLARRPPKKRVQ